eukprot:tig00021038_g17496.t1
MILQLRSQSLAIARLDQQSKLLDGKFTRMTHDGTGVDIYVLDTGIDDTHPELAGRVIRLHDVDTFYANTSAAWVSECSADSHGTAVASVLAPRPRPSRPC